MTKTIALARKLAESGKKEADNTDYWNQYYHNRVCSTQPCPFAQYVATLVEPGKTLVDLGCGNGRDSLYFAQQGLQVVGIDLSPTAIELIRAQQVPNAQFVCGDFISNPAHTPGRYDYAYSCFTIHAINPKQETMLLQSMYQALKSGGGKVAD